MAVKRVFILAGEASGDVLGAEFLRALRAVQPDWYFDAWGGPELSRALGKPVLRGLESLAFMGFLDVLRNGRKVLTNLREAKAILEEPWDLVLLVDYPGFNLRLAKWMAKRPWRSERRVVQLVAPSVWAWKESRVEILAKAFDAVIPLLPFEPDFLHQRGVNAPYFGHPGLDRYESDSSTSQSIGLVLAPGSRRSELERLVPVFAATAERLGQIPLWIRPSSWTETQYRVLLRGILNAEPRGTIAQGMGSAKGARLALVASGTATLELGILGIPMVVAYRVDPLSFAIAKRLVTVKHVSLVNLVLGRGAVAEHLQESCNPENLVRELQKINAEGPERKQMLDDLAEFRSMLGDSGAMDRIAHYVLTL